MDRSLSGRKRGAGCYSHLRRGRYVQTGVFCSSIEEVIGPEEEPGVYHHGSGVTSHGPSQGGGLEKTGEGAYLRTQCSVGFDGRLWRWPKGAAALIHVHAAQERPWG